MIIDVAGLDLTGYPAGDWLRSHRQIDPHICEHRRISAQLTHADTPETVGRLLTALAELTTIADTLRPVAQADVPDPTDLRLEQALLPHEAFFGPTEHIPTATAAGRIAAPWGPVRLRARGGQSLPTHRSGLPAARRSPPAARRSPVGRGAVPGAAGRVRPFRIPS
ncbi:hypothetical protein [Kitasatospora sp. NPDC048407]|uniref:hypothetical protein n=1 Tax=Kitasatospora sp. NPDC048407 TaxID=3364051 RepID=UPI00371D6182